MMTRRRVAGGKQEGSHSFAQGKAGGNGMCAESGSPRARSFGCF